MISHQLELLVPSTKLIIAYRLCHDGLRNLDTAVSHIPSLQYVRGAAGKEHKPQFTRELILMNAEALACKYWMFRNFPCFELAFPGTCRWTLPLAPWP